MGASPHHGNGTIQCHVQKRCREPIVPIWNTAGSVTEYSTTEKILWSIVYFVILVYLLFGVTIITDRILSAAEVICSQRKTVTVKSLSGEVCKKNVRIWHPIVAFLVFEVIGTCAPEIILPLLEVFHHKLQGDDLGPALIIGSAAYHLLVITAICLLSIRDPAPKPIKNLPIFFTTATFAIVAYLWVYLILQQISPGVIELWESVVTLLLYFILVFITWAAARRLPMKWLGSLARLFNRLVSPLGTQSEENSGGSIPTINEVADLELAEGGTGQKRRKQLADMLRNLKTKNPNKTNLELETIAQKQVIDEMPKNAAYYRLQATHAIVGSGSIGILTTMINTNRKEKLEKNCQIVGFTTEKHSCYESCQSTVVTVERKGDGIDNSVVTCQCDTVEGTAKANENFLPIMGRRICFDPGQTTVTVPVKIVADDIFEEEDKFFKLRLSNLSIYNYKDNEQPLKLLSKPFEVTINIKDDDHCGVFSFDKTEMAVPDNIGRARVKVVRSVGNRGNIAMLYSVIPGTAKPQQDYLSPPRGELIFNDGQLEAFIPIDIIDKDRTGDVHNFYIQLSSPKKFSVDIKTTLGDPVLGEPKLVQIGICEDEEMKEALDRLMNRTDLNSNIMSATWKDQLVWAFTIFHGISNESMTCPIKLKYFLLHVISFPWKLAVAILPPARLGQGYVAYLSLFGLMVLVSAFISDCVTLVGCTLGLKPTVTALTFIPFGLALPDLFASRRAAMYEKTADTAIGAIVASNAVTVFLGMGLAWTVGSAYRLSIKDTFVIPASEHLGFSVMTYCTFATAVILVLLLRRLPPIGGELGGPITIKYLTAIFFILLWAVFVIVSVLNDYCIIFAVI